MKTLDHQARSSRPGCRAAAFHQSGTSTPHLSREVSSGRVLPHLPQITTTIHITITITSTITITITVKIAVTMTITSTIAIFVAIICILLFLYL